MSSPSRQRLSRGIAVALMLAGMMGATEIARPAGNTAASPQHRPAGSAPWWTHAVIYEIYPRSFQDSNGDGVGDLKGITRRLDYLEDLGVDAIWITPFFPSPNADFGYDISNYTGVAAEYGTMADWDELVRQARRRGIRILVDLVLNHTSDQHPWFLESRASRNNPKRNWYIWRDGQAGGEPPTHWPSIFKGTTWEFDRRTGQWYYHVFLPQQPDLNWAEPGVRKAMYGVARFWLDHGASGFRLDATPYLYEDTSFPEDPAPASGPPAWLKPYNSGRPETHGVLRELRAVLDGYPGERVLLGESATATIEELAQVYGTHHDEINLPMDFLIGNMTRLDAAAFKKQYDDAESKLHGEPPVLFFSSHDHPRQWSAFGNGTDNDQIARLTATLTLAARGTALLYYGEEIGMGNLPDADLADFPLGPKRPRADERDPARSPMQWTAGPCAGFTTGAPWLPIAADSRVHNVASERTDPQSLYHWYAGLTHLRRRNAAMREGDYLPLESGNPMIFSFGRRARDGSGVLVVLNTGNVEQEANISGWSGATAGFGSVLMASPQALAPSGWKFSLAPYGVMLIAIRPPR